MIDLEAIKARAEAATAQLAFDGSAAHEVLTEDVTALVAEVERLRESEARQHGVSRETRQYIRDVIAELLAAHDAAQRRDDAAYHSGNRYETAGEIYEKVVEISARRISQDAWNDSEGAS